MALKSMTGYGAATFKERGVQLSVEIKTVNSRFLDVSFKLPSYYQNLESELSKIIKGFLKRGRVDVYISRIEADSEKVSLAFNEEAFKAYLQIADKAFKLAKAKSVDREELVLNLLGRREVVEGKVSEPDTSEYKVVQRTLRNALNHVSKMREREGKVIEAELLSYVRKIEKLVFEITKLSKVTPREYKAKLAERLKRANVTSIDKERLAQEVAFFADRIDVSEELSRLKSHINHFFSLFRDPDAGKKLDFLGQELLREVNTVGSKCQNAKISKLVVEIKALLEKVKEQVQNVE